MRATVVSNRNQKKKKLRKRCGDSNSGGLDRQNCTGLQRWLVDIGVSGWLLWEQSTTMNENTQQGGDGRSGTRIKTRQLQGEQHLCTRLLSLKMPALKPHSDCWVSLPRSTRVLHLAQSSSSFRVAKLSKLLFGKTKQYPSTLRELMGLPNSNLVLA